jgi:hypothetical protein
VTKKKKKAALAAPVEAPVEVLPEGDSTERPNIWSSGAMLIKEEPYNRDEVQLWYPPGEGPEKPVVAPVPDPVKILEGLPEKSGDLLPVLDSPPMYGISPQGQPNPVRYHLDDERLSRTCKFSLSSQSDKGETTPVEGYFTVGLYPDGTPGELFIEMGKSGHEMNGFANCWAIAISMLLQYGVHPQKLYNKFRAREFFPNGVTSLKGVPIAKSIPDLVMRWMQYNLAPTAKTISSADEEWNHFVQTMGAKVIEVEPKK